MTQLAAVRAALDANPRLRRLFEEVFGWIAQPQTAVAVGGSASRGEVDAQSDLDFVWLTKDPADRPALHRFLEEHYPVIACFDAAHLGLSCLDSVFVVAEGIITKLDIAFWDAAGGPPPIGGVVVHDPAGLWTAPLTGLDEVLRAPGDLPGWVCHVRKIVARGELFEAAHCLNEIRRRMLVPLLLEVAGQPQVNYRRLEQRLSTSDIEALQRTCPASPTAKELTRALHALVEQFTVAYLRIPAARQSQPPPKLSCRLRLALTGPI